MSENQNVFDNITGTSIGAINASIIINHFIDTPKLEEYNRYHKVKGGIRTSIDQNERRFLLVAANIQTAKPETFDSYDTNNITINHVLANAAIPINYPHMEINENKYWDGGN